MMTTLLSPIEEQLAPRELVEPATVLDPTRPTVYYFPDQRTWRLAQTFVRAQDGHVLTIPAPFDFDLASIPRLLWGWLACHELGILAPLVHDWLYRGGGAPTHGSIVPPRSYTRTEADRLFLEHMREDGVGRMRATLAYTAVRLFGRSSWRGRPTTGG